MIARLFYGRESGTAMTTSRLNNTYAWGMTLTLPVQVLIPDNALAPWLALVLFAVYVGFAIADTRTVKAAGRDASLAVAIMLGIVYLWMRPKRTGQNYTIPIVATVCGVGSIVFQAL